MWAREQAAVVRGPQGEAGGGIGVASGRSVSPPCPSRQRSRSWRALQRFRAPLSKLKIGDFAEPQVLYQIGMPPSRIDIMTSVTGLEFDEAWLNRITARFGDVVAPVLGLEDMRKAKRAAGRLKDLADLMTPEEVLERRHEPVVDEGQRYDRLRVQFGRRLGPPPCTE